ncbi:Gfo/Idh/MocA family protein [Nitratireductor basaltis]|uniref:Oxidoreductase-like protein n=1 Tax=Nitratireductor basaltis TaxID=472175 RepID=A0A084UAU5_9HYPH|nr:Gfo/Idh/MocA family oxidoreductase [Nitratireductor basaltis]KFB10081.1 Oxidoreductase-like protein [Nitratireductor basaltis]
MSGKPRIGFLGLGWIGRMRMEALGASGIVEISALCDPSGECLREAAMIAPDARMVADLDELLSLDLDGIVIATPSAMHAAQSIRCLEAGVAVFCQKPLGRNAPEVADVVAAARRADRLLGLDLSYRHTAAMQKIREELANSRIGRLFSADLVFHNAYGPDKPWFYDVSQSGGGCVVDLGVHLVDLMMWVTGFQKVTQVTSSLYAKGKRLGGNPDTVEDYAVSAFELADGTSCRLACSWGLSAGKDAEITATFYGTNGALEMRNIDGSFFDFEAAVMHGTTREVLVVPPDEWGGKALIAWAEQLTRSRKFDESAEEHVLTAGVLDRIYGREEVAQPRLLARAG